MVVDASALVDVAIESRASVRDRLSSAQTHSPHHVDAEVGQALRRLTLTGHWDANASAEALQRTAQLIDVRHDIPGELSAYAWTLRENVSFHDALYVALAVLLDAPLITADGRLARAGLPCRVEVAGA